MTHIRPLERGPKEGADVPKVSTSYLHYGDEFRAKSLNGEWITLPHAASLGYNACKLTPKASISTADPETYLHMGKVLILPGGSTFRLEEGANGSLIGMGDYVILYKYFVDNGTVKRLYCTHGEYIIYDQNKPKGYPTALEERAAFVYRISARPYVGGLFDLEPHSRVNLDGFKPYKLMLAEISSHDQNSADAELDEKIQSLRTQHAAIEDALSKIEESFVNAHASLRPALLRAFFLEHEAAIMGLIAPDTSTSAADTPDTATASSQQAIEPSLLGGKSLAIFLALGVALTLLRRA